MSPEHRSCVRSGLMHGVDQRCDPRRHYQQVLGSFVASVPIGVGRPAAGEHCRSRPDFHFFVPETESEFPLEYVPGLVVLVMDVKSSDPLIAYLRSPLHKYEVVAQTAETIA
jgi:hypothetical protein